MSPYLAMTNATQEDQGRDLLIMAGTGWVQALDAGDGALVWNYALDLPKPTTPSVGVTDGKVIVACSGQLYCLDYETGARVWQRPCLSATSRPTLLVEGDRIVLAGTSRAECFGLDGKQRWAGNAPAVTGYIALATRHTVAQADVGA